MSKTAKAKPNKYIVTLTFESIDYFTKKALKEFIEAKLTTTTDDKVRVRTVDLD